jgi:hypothetical protein
MPLADGFAVATQAVMVPAELLMPLSLKSFADRMDWLFNGSGRGIRRFQNQE